jgi:1-deoxy-D-xylulose 5-phosphate reductoisomerase
MQRINHNNWIRGKGYQKRILIKELKGKIKFLEIARLIKHMMDKHKVIKDPTIEEILEVDAGVKEETRENVFK